MTLAEQFVKEVEENASKGNVGLDLFHDTVLKYKGKRPEDLEDINSVNTLVGSADPESVKKRVSLAGDFTSKLASGESIQATSTDVASGKRQQQKPKTPVIVNAPTTNTTTVVKNESVRNPKEKKADTGQTLFERAA